MSLTELEVAERIRDGTVPSPVKFSNMWLVNLRITGTGLAYRAGLKEHVWRDPKLYLSEEFLRRCNGLPVIANHPDDAVLTEEDFKSRIVCNFAFFSGLFDAQFWAGSAQPKSPELTANY